MGGNRSPWRALRPVFLAGAATLTWLTLSASAASADTLPDAASLLGGVTASVSSVTEKLPVPAAAAPAAAPATSAPVSSPGLLQPLVGEVSGLTDQIFSSVPVVNQVVPAGTVAVITVPIAQLADAATGEVAEAVVPPVAEALPVLEPVLQPVSDLVTGTAPLPVPLPDLDEIVEDAATDAAETEVAAGLIGATENEAVSDTAARGTSDSSGTTTSPAGSVALAKTSSPPRTTMSAPDLSQEQPGTAGPSPAPAHAPPAPGSGAGSIAHSAGSSGPAAWLSPYNLDLSLPGAVRAGEISAHVPEPVSFDPGSSPD